MRTSDPSLNPPEHPVQPMVEQAHEASPAPHRQSPGSITLKGMVPVRVAPWVEKMTRDFLRLHGVRPADEEVSQTTLSTSTH